MLARRKEYQSTKPHGLNIVVSKRAIKSPPKVVLRPGGSPSMADIGKLKKKPVVVVSVPIEKKKKEIKSLALRTLATPTG